MVTQETRTPRHPLDRSSSPSSSRGTIRALWRLARPTGALWVLLLPLIGFGFAHWDYAIFLRNPGSMGILLLAWACLHAGTMWLNACLDAGEGPVLFGSSDFIPSYTSQLAYAALAMSVVLGFVAAPGSGICAAFCAVSAVLYSHPRIAWKGHPVAGPAINALGYGIASPLAGYLVLQVPLTVRLAACLLVGVGWVLGIYFSAQAFQRDDDAARGHRTLVVTHGPQAVLRVARISMRLGDAAIIALIFTGWFPVVGWGVVPFLLLRDRHMARWARQPDGGDESWGRRLALLIVLCGAIGIGLASGQYAWDFLHWEPVAGFGTRAGHPPRWREVHNLEEPQ